MLSRASRASADRRGPELHTRFSREFGLRVPLASAGMAFVGLSDLAAAVSNAGALGVYGVGPEPPPVVAARIQAIRDQTSGPFGIDFIVAASPLGTFTTQDHIDVVAAARVPVVVFHWNLPEQSWVKQLRAAGSTVWIQTGDVHVARQGVALGIDGVVAQGRAAGGHNRNSTIPTLQVVDMMRRALPREIFILAAGGVSDGASLVQAIRAGADGGWAGTVFVAAEESYASDGYKARLIATHSPEATTFSSVFGPEFPDAQQRVLRNHATANPGATTPATIGTTTLFPGVLNVPYTMPLHSAIVPTRDTHGNLDEMDMPAGSVSVRAVRRVRPAAEIVEDFIDGAREALERGDLGDCSLDG
ncbi:MAG TPA: nitronate monooxygenase [Kofleriaceae bacterium]|jgi:enoyl-[acyl-carrier protein] reductase II|nr:nitronate monooxygenase [Kofleriaceae bacterium]